jgi:hypothetical protein
LLQDLIQGRQLSLTFLLTEEGRLLDTNVANKTGDVVYLYLTPGRPFTLKIRLGATEISYSG